MDAELSVEFECKREYEWPDASTKIDKAQSNTACGMRYRSRIYFSR